MHAVMWVFEEDGGGKGGTAGYRLQNSDQSWSLTDKGQGGYFVKQDSWLQTASSKVLERNERGDIGL